MKIEERVRLLFRHGKILILMCLIVCSTKLLSQEVRIVYSALRYDSLALQIFYNKELFKINSGRVLIISKDSIRFVSAQYDSNSQRFGKWVYYYKNGNVKKITNYKNSKEVGHIYEFYETELIKKEFYLNDLSQLDSVYKEWYENGVLKSVQHYKEGSPQGDYKLWDSKGQIFIYGKFCSLFYFEGCNCIAFDNNGTSVDMLLQDQWYSNGIKRKEFVKIGVTGNEYKYYEYDMNGNIIGEQEFSKGYLKLNPNIYFYNLIKIIK